MTDNIYLLLGPENGEKKEFIGKIKENAAKKYGSEAEEYSFYPYDSDMVEIVSILRNVSLFSLSKIVVINNFDELKKKDLSVLLEYLKNPADDSYLILVSENIKADSRLERAVPPGNRKIFWEMFESRKKSWITNFFRREKVKIENSAVDFLNDILETDSEILKKECEKLVQYFDKNEIITEEKIENFFYERKEENLFSLFERIASCDLQKSVETSRNIFLSGESNPVQILGGLTWQLRNLHELRGLTDRSNPFPEACQMLNIRGKKMQKSYQEGVRNFKQEELEAVIAMTAEYDSLFRSIRQDMQLILFPVFLYYLIEKKGKDAFTLLNSRY